LLGSASCAKHKAALSVAYGAGLRASEVVSLKVSDIDSARMVLRVEQGNGRKDRYAMLSPMLLDILREWWRIGRPCAWLFPGQNPVNPMTTRQLRREPWAQSFQTGISMTRAISSRSLTIAADAKYYIRNEARLISQGLMRRSTMQTINISEV